MPTDDLQSSYEQAIAVLDQLREQGPVKAYNDLREEIASRWPERPAGRDAAAWLARTHTEIEKRALEEALAREAQYRALVAQWRHESRQSSLAEIEVTKARAAGIVDAVKARQNGMHARREGLHPLALVYAERAFELRPDVYSGMFLASSLRHAGHLDAALDRYRSLWPERSERYRVATGAAAILADQGKITEAWDLLEPQLGQLEDSHHLALASRLRRLLGDLAAAERYLRRAVERFSGAHKSESVRREVRELVRQATDSGQSSVAAAAQGLQAT
jgi:hypothetical protein